MKSSGYGAAVLGLALHKLLFADRSSTFYANSFALSMLGNENRPRVGPRREPRVLDPKSCYACWMVMPTLARDCKGEPRGLGAARGSNPNSASAGLGHASPPTVRLYLRLLL
jgi:hypothetical protein